MNAPYIVGTIVTIVTIALSWFSYRMYKRVARRCRRKDCGRLGVKRIYKIILPPDESIGFRSPNGKFRWFVRRPIKLTFTKCKCGWIELVKIDTDPISTWHLLWTKCFHRSQFYTDEPELIPAALAKFRSIHLGGLGAKNQTLEPQASDTPPLSLKTILEDYAEELMRQI